MTCPRCQAEMIEHEPDKTWRRWWECKSCDSAWHLVRVAHKKSWLEQGRDINPMGKEAGA